MIPHIKKIIFISTPSIYFTGKDRCNISENEPLPDRQASNYSKTKLISETELMALQQEGYKVIIFRPRALYGPFDNTIIPYILRLADKKQMPLNKIWFIRIKRTFSKSSVVNKGFRVVGTRVQGFKDSRGQGIDENPKPADPGDNR